MPSMTGFGLHSKAKLASKDGKFYQAWLWQKGFGGSTSTVRLSSENPMVISWGRSGSDVYVPILACHAELNGLRLTTEYDDLVGAASDAWRLEIQKGDSHSDIDNDSGTRIFLGRVLSDIYEDSTMGDVHTLNLQAVDGLGSLEEVPYYDTDSDPGERLAYEGRESLLTILIRALGKLGYSLPIRSAIAWRPTTVSGAEDTLAEVDVDNLAFYEISGEAMSCYAVAEEISRRLGARLFQYEGAWWIVSRELMTGSAYTYFKYTSDGTADGTDTGGAAVDTSSATKTTGKRVFRPAFSRVGVVQRHGPIPPVIDEGEFTVELLAGRYKEYGKYWCTVRPKFVEGVWSYTGNANAREAEPSIALKKVIKRGEDAKYVATGPEITFTSEGPTYQWETPIAERNFVHAVPSYIHDSGSRDPATVKADVANGNLSTSGPHYAERTGKEVAAGTFLNFSGRVTIEKDEGEGTARWTPYWSIKIVGTNYYLKGDGTWDQSTTASDIVQYLWAPGGDMRFGEYGVQLESEQGFSITSAVTPAAGEIRLRLYGTSDRGSDIDPGETLWDDVHVLVVDKSGETLTAERNEVYIVDNPEPGRADIEVVLGEAAGVIFPPTLTDNGTKTSDWTSARIGSATTLGLIHAETVLRHQSSYVETRSEAYEGLTGSPLSPLLISSSHYPIQELRLDLYHQVSSGEWCKLQWDAPTTGSASGATDVRGTSSRGGGGGGSTAGVSTAAETIAGGVTVRYGTATVTDTSGAGGTVTVTPPLVTTTLASALIQLTPHTNAEETHFGLENVTSTTFDIRAITSDGSDVTFTWWVLETEISALYGEWHFDEARNSHHLLTI